MSIAKHQIFISSTHDDLIEERQKLFMTTYRMNHIPIGMEGFTASNLSQWEYIQQRVIECDYFVIVVAHRYGSLIPDDSGRSFTEAEYDFAMKLGKPILRFIISDAMRWEQDEKHRENSAKIQKKLASFKKKLSESKLVSYWDDSINLENCYSQAISNQIRTNPVGGLFPAGANPELKALGIKHISKHSNSVNHEDLLKASGKVTIVLNDGYNFFKKYDYVLQDRLEKGHLTQVLLVHPDSRNLDLIAKKSNKEIEQQRSDIIRAIVLLKEMNDNNAKNLLQCRGHHYFNNYCGTISETGAIISLYYSRMRSPELTTLHLNAIYDGLYASYLEDVDQLWRDAERDIKANLFNRVL